MLDTQSKGFVLDILLVSIVSRPLGHGKCTTHLINRHEIRVIIDSICLERAVLMDKRSLNLFVKFHGVCLAIGMLASRLFAGDD